jgi:uncharacterized protein YndB with AHSA1/START domain
MSAATEPAVSTAEIVVAVPPDRAFEAFTSEINRWWKLDSMYWNDEARRKGLRFEPYVGGRFIEIYDENGEGFELGRVTAWDPGRKLAFTWSQSRWPDDAITDVEITFAAVDEGTRVRLVHTGFEQVPGGADLARGYGAGWSELLGWYAEASA